MRLVAATCVGLSIVNIIFMVIYYLTVPEAQAGDVLQLTVALVITQAVIMMAGIALFRFHKVGWIAFWPLGIWSLVLIAKLIELQYRQSGELQSIPFFVGIEQVLWFVPSGICLLLPSSRRCYFNIPDQLWMHQKVLRHGESTIGDVSGRPRQPAGISVLAWIAMVVAAGMFVSAMLTLAQPEGPDPEGINLSAVIGWKVFAAVCVMVASSGLMRKSLWGWYAMLGCAVVGCIAVSGLRYYASAGGMAAQFHVTTEGLLLCLVWCGSAIFYLMLPVTRHAFFSRKGSRF